MPTHRFTDAAAEALRDAIREAGGVEVYAVGDVETAPTPTTRRVTRIEVHARGTDDAVLALQSRPRSGQVVIHNHPSGDLRPSNPDMSLAGTFGEEGIGFVIVDSEVTRSNWIVEPLAKKVVPVDPKEIEVIFLQRLPALYPGWEPRPGQLDMALRVADTLHHGGVSVLEAGTGTGKSLAYLVPAGLWALTNDTKVVVSTYTRTLQGQLVHDDLPTVARLLGAEKFRYALQKGRNNYLCRRKLELAVGDPHDAERSGTTGVLLPRVAEWARTTPTGDIADAGFAIDDDTWDLVESDSDQTLRARCPHFNTCFYYQARRRAGAAHIIVVNHALLLRDLAVKAAADGVGVLPKYDRVVLDEGHHLENAATSAGAARLSALTVSRAVLPLIGRTHRVGALARLGEKFDEVAPLVGAAVDALTLVRDTARTGFEVLREGRTQAERVTEAPPQAEFFADLAEELDAVTARLGAVEAALTEVKVPPEQAQPLLDLQKGRRRLEEAASVARSFLDPNIEWCRYLDPGTQGIAAARAPVDIAPFCREHLVEGLEAVVVTSATLAVNGRIDHYLERTGLTGAEYASYPSPFRYEEQAILAMPRDLPPPDDPTFTDRAADVITAAIRVSRGGAFVLCTSHDAVRQLSMRVARQLDGAYAILTQGRGARERLLDQFRADPASVLFGTDSFWEGVSVKGDALRLVIIPRLPFRVPTEPVAQARYERLRARGQDPFRAYALPEAVLKLRQGFGRLIRARTDRGAVLLLDRRVHEMWYGRVFLASLPPARRVVGPTRAVLEQLSALYGERGRPRLDVTLDGPGSGGLPA